MMKFLIYPALLLLVLSCAQVRPLPGGKKDTNPPEALLYAPDSMTTFFNGNSFEITFDEYVTLNNIAQELVVSPPLKALPKTKLRKRTLQVAWDDTLQTNTTYVFYFGDGVADLNENNKAVDLKYVLSTGSTIDSLKINLAAKDVWKGTAYKGARVALFSTDTAVFGKKPRPSAIGKTNDDGKALLRYLRNQPFSAYVFDDQNGNYGWDPNEAFAFLDSSITPGAADSTAYQFLLSVPRPDSLVINEYKTDSVGTIRMAWDSYFGYPHVEVVEGNSAIKTFFNANKDSLTCWFAPSDVDKTVKLRVLVENKILDTLEVNVYEEAVKKSFDIKPVDGTKVFKEKALYLSGLSWLEKIDPALMSLSKDSTSVPFQAMLDSIHPDQIQVKTQWLSGGKYKLKMLPGALTNRYTAVNDTAEFNITVYTEEDLGLINLHLSIPSSLQNGRLKLMTTKEKPVEERSISAGTQDISFRQLIPGEYYLRIIDDANANGLWDPCVPEEKKAAEKVWVSGFKINVRANWEVEQKWEITE